MAIAQSSMLDNNEINENDCFRTHYAFNEFSAFGRNTVTLGCSSSFLHISDPKTIMARHGHCSAALYQYTDPIL